MELIVKLNTFDLDLESFEEDLNTAIKNIESGQDMSFVSVFFNGDNESIDGRDCGYVDFLKKSNVDMEYIIKENNLHLFLSYYLYVYSKKINKFAKAEFNLKEDYEILLLPYNSWLGQNIYIFMIKSNQLN